MNKAVITTIVALKFCFNAFAREAKGKDWTEAEWKKEKGSYCGSLATRAVKLTVFE